MLGTCVVFETWRINGRLSMLLSWYALAGPHSLKNSTSLIQSLLCDLIHPHSLVIVGVAFAFEALRFRMAVYDRQVAAQLLQQARRPDGPGNSSGRNSPAIDTLPIGGV